MTDPLTPAEKGYYADLIDVAMLIADHLRTENPEWKLQFALKVFEKIASPLHFLRQEGAPAMTDVTPAPEQAVHGGATVWRLATKPTAQGMTHYAREDYVKADALPILQYLRVHPTEAKHGWARIDGFTYTLSRYHDHDYLWRKATPKEAGDPMVKQLVGGEWKPLGVTAEEYDQELKRRAKQQEAGDR